MNGIILLDLKYCNTLNDFNAAVQTNADKGLHHFVAKKCRQNLHIINNKYKLQFQNGSADIPYSKQKVSTVFWQRVVFKGQIDTVMILTSSLAAAFLAVANTFGQL